jgi:hypothetical protein
MYRLGVARIPIAGRKYPREVTMGLKLVTAAVASLLAEAEASLSASKTS